MPISLEEYAKCLHTYYVIGCAVRERGKFCFIAERWYTDDEVDEEEDNRMNPAYRDKHLVLFNRGEQPGKQWSHAHFEGWGTVHIGAAARPLNQAIMIELEESHCYVIGGGEKYRDAPVEEARGGIRRIKMIDGYAYACGGARWVGRRLGKGQWMSYAGALPLHATIGDGGFDDIAGFNERDLYAAGGKGDVWHYNGEVWQQLAFPTDSWTTAVCCGGDGKVYISCYEGLTLMGRENRWTKIDDGGIPLGFKDMVWHDGKVWCTNDNGLWTIENARLKRVTGLPPAFSACAGRLSVSDGVMLMAGMGGAAFHEHGQWHSLFLRGEMETAVRLANSRE